MDGVPSFVSGSKGNLHLVVNFTKSCLEIYIHLEVFRSDRIRLVRYLKSNIFYNLIFVILSLSRYVIIFFIK